MAYGIDEVNRRLLLVKFWRSQKWYMIFACPRSQHPNPCVVQRLTVLLLEYMLEKAEGSDRTSADLRTEELQNSQEKGS